jgi:hypothetical protein
MSSNQKQQNTLFFMTVFFTCLEYFSFPAVFELELKICSSSQGWWYTSVIPALRILRQEDLKFKINLGYMDRCYL